MTNIETVIGASGAETLTIVAALSSASLDFAAGADTITLANAANSATLTNIETISGVGGADTMTSKSRWKSSPQRSCAILIRPAVEPEVRLYTPIFLPRRSASVW